VLVVTTSEVMRIMGVWVRRADAGLAVGAARNAATSVAEARTRSAQGAHALQDLDEALDRRGVLPPPSSASVRPEVAAASTG
jgi:triphosphoribosyl-dephospho-CoA synthetase